MSAYPQNPTFPIDVRPGRFVSVSRVGAAVKLDIQDDALSTLAKPGNPIGDGIKEGSDQAVSSSLALMDRVNINDARFYLVGDGQDFGPAMQRASDFFGSLPASVGGIIDLPRGGNWPIKTNVALGRNVVLRGPVGRADQGNPFGNTAAQDAFFKALRDAPSLVIAPTVTIALGAGGGLSCVYAYRQGMALDGSDLPASFQGKAFSATQADSTFIEHTTILGFEVSIEHVNCSRVLLNDVLIDCLNGPRCLGSGDINRYFSVHCYGVVNRNATGREAFSDRAGYGFYFGGTNNGGPILMGCFSYSFQVGLFTEAPGHLSLISHWIDGTVDTNGLPRVPSRVGLLYGGTANAEPHVINLKICSQGTAIVFAAGNYGSIQFGNVLIFGCNIGINVSAKRLILSNFAIRGYNTAAIVFNSAEAANTAKLIGGVLYDRTPGALDVNCGGGDPTVIAVSYDGDILNCQNKVRTTVAPVSGVITVPNGKEDVLITGTGAISDFLPKIDGYWIRAQFVSAGSTVSGANLKLASAFTATADGSLMLQFNAPTGKWVEKGRAAL